MKSLDFVDEWLKERGVPAQIHTFFEPKEHQSFTARMWIGIRDSGKPGPVIYLGGHLTLYSCATDGQKPPYEGVIEGDDMYGVGALWT